MLKNLTLLLLLGFLSLPLSVSADWSSYSSIGSFGNLDFFFRTLDYRNGTNVQFKIVNHNSSPQKVTLANKTYSCRNGTTERREPTTEIISGNSTFESLPDSLVCQGHGGFSSLDITFGVQRP